jgi:hypothetical protein
MGSSSPSPSRIPNTMGAKVNLYILFYGPSSQCQLGLILCSPSLLFFSVKEHAFGPEENGKKYSVS